MQKRQAFTLVEIMVVVVIIGLLAAIAIPGMTRVRENTLMTRFMNDVRVFRDALQTATFETGNLNLGSDSGSAHPLLAPYIDVQKFGSPTPLGGQWDVEYNKSNVTLGVGVHGYSVTNEFLLRLDQKFDDGSLTTGKLRRIVNDRYYWVIID